MRVLLITAALLLGAAGTASAEFIPYPPPAGQRPCNDTVTVPVPVSAAACGTRPMPKPTTAQLKLIAAFKIRAIWGTYAARHIARYGCDTFDLVPGQSTVCAVRFRTRRGNAATRRIRLAYVARGDRVGVLVSRVPRYPVPQTTTEPAPTATTPEPSPPFVSAG